MNKTRVDTLEEKIQKKNRKPVAVKVVNLHNGIYTSKNDEPLTKDKFGNFLYKDGTMYYKNEPLPDNQIGL
ncbi:MAG TPA: hypothetical protein EYH42_07580, partial [Sulfurovum sp.]|nr:hypothetical protein [Sulfurovum sp.]